MSFNHSKNLLVFHIKYLLQTHDKFIWLEISFIVIALYLTYTLLYCVQNGFFIVKISSLLSRYSPHGSILPTNVGEIKPNVLCHLSNFRKEKSPMYFKT